MKDLPERYGARLFFTRHGDLHAGLLKHLDATEGLPVELNLDTEITGINCEEGTIQLPDGSVVKKDLVILANGLGVSVFVPVKLMLPSS